MYQNPIIPGFYPDPSVCRVGQDFYLVTSSFNYLPGIPVFHSIDLVNWRQIGHCITRPGQLDFSETGDSEGIWAPTIRHHEGRFYVVSTMIDRANFNNRLTEDFGYIEPSISGRHFVVSARNPAGPWSDPVWLPGAGIDPSLYIDDDGSVLMTHSENGAIIQGAIDIATGERRSAPLAIWQGTDEVDSEGPHLYRIGRYYYLLVAEGGTSYEHSIAVARSASPWGPWEENDKNPLLSQRKARGAIQATGHGELIEDAEGLWWLVFLGVRPVGYPRYHTLGRETCLVPIEWQDEWPRVSSDVGPMIHARDREQHARPSTWRDAFVTDQRALEWASPGCFPAHAHPTDGVLRIDLPHDAETPDPRDGSMVGIRQDSPYARVDARFNLGAREANAELGLTVHMDSNHYYRIFAVSVDESQTLVFERRVGDLHSRELLGPLPDNHFALRIEASPYAYRLSWVNSVDGAPLVSRAGQSRLLSSEVAGGFTGVFFGVHARGEQQSTLESFELERLQAEVWPRMPRSHPQI